MFQNVLFFFVLLNSNYHKSKTEKTAEPTSSIVLYTSRALRLDCSYESVWTDLCFFLSLYGFSPLSQLLQCYPSRTAIMTYGRWSGGMVHTRTLQCTRRTYRCLARHSYKVRAFVNFMQKIQRHWEANKFAYRKDDETVFEHGDETKCARKRWK